MADSKANETEATEVGKLIIEGEISLVPSTICNAIRVHKTIIWLGPYIGLRMKENFKIEFFQAL